MRIGHAGNDRDLLRDFVLGRCMDTNGELLGVRKFGVAEQRNAATDDVDFRIAAGGKFRDIKDVFGSGGVCDMLTY